jgi:hypothetical protein
MTLPPIGDCKRVRRCFPVVRAALKVLGPSLFYKDELRVEVSPPSMYGGRERTTKYAEYAEYAKVKAGRIVGEIKAVKTLADEHRAQMIHCLKAMGTPRGLPVTFGHSPKIEHQRFVNQPFSRLLRFS